MIFLQSVNTGSAQPIRSKTGRTGIFKTARSGPVRIHPLGLEGDTIVDKKNHGGPDQAVYIYLARDYDWWSEELGEALGPGTFGENLTISGLDGEGLAVGDRIETGDVILEITSPRIPCSTFAARMGDSRFPKRFLKAMRPGAYCRVVREGAVSEGDAVTYTPFAGEKLLVTELVGLESARRIDETTLRRCLAAPVHYKIREDYEERLASLEATPPR